MQPNELSAIIGINCFSEGLPSELLWADGLSATPLDVPQNNVQETNISK